MGQEAFGGGRTGCTLADVRRCWLSLLLVEMMMLAQVGRLASMMLLSWPHDRRLQPGASKTRPLLAADAAVMIERELLVIKIIVVVVAFLAASSPAVIVVLLGVFVYSLQLDFRLDVVVIIVLLLLFVIVITLDISNVAKTEQDSASLASDIFIILTRGATLNFKARGNGGRCAKLRRPISRLVILAPIGSRRIVSSGLVHSAGGAARRAGGGRFLLLFVDRVEPGEILISGGRIVSNAGNTTAAHVLRQP